MMATTMMRLLAISTRYASHSKFTKSCLPNANRLRLRLTSDAASMMEDSRKLNWRCRVDLAAAYRAFEKLALHEAVCNHLSMIAPAASGHGEVMLITPYGLHWSEITASSLVGLNDKLELVEGTEQVETAAATIHHCVHKARPDAICVFHLHPPYAAALSALKNAKLGMFHQNSCRFYNRIAYDREYGGLGTHMKEGERLAKQLGDKSILLMCNHGVLVTGNSAARAFDDMYFLERACRTQVLAMSTGQQLTEIPDEIVRLTNQQMDGLEEREKFCEAHFSGMKRCLDRECPDYRE